MKPDKTFFRVIADPDLPKEDRKLFAAKNPLVGQTFPTKEAARIALYYSEVAHYNYKVVQCWPSGALI
jgi:hypothetical protein